MAQDQDSMQGAIDRFGHPADRRRSDHAAQGADVDDDGHDHASTRLRILEAAATVFREKGFTGTRVVDIARAAGYTSGALYGYFDSRAELLAEAIANASSEMLGQLLGGEAGAADPGAVLDAVLARLTEPLGEADQMLLDGVALAHREPIAGQRLAGALREFRGALGSDEAGTDGSADLLVVLVLGITAARALGLHDELPTEVRAALAGCVTA